MADSALSRSNIRRISPLRQGETSSRGSAIPTAGQRMAAEDAANTTQRGILELRRRQMMGQGATGTPTTGGRISGKPTVIGSGGAALRGAEDEIWSKPGVRPEGSKDGGNVWVTSGGGVVNKDARDPNDYSYNPKTGLVTGTQMAWDKGDGQFSNGSSAPSTTPSPAASPAATTQRPAPAPLLARPRQGMIDGKPAAQVLSGMREDAARGTTPAQTYGADVAKRNIEERGPQAAIEDYFNRNRLDAQRAPMPTEPGSMAERRASAEKNQTRPNAIGPAQRAMLDARQSREDRAKRDSEDQRNYDTLRARDITENVGYRLGQNAATTDDVINKNLSFADRRDQLQSERGYKDNDVTDNLVSEALRSNPANPPEFFKDFTGESER